MPLVSVVITTYNRADLVGDAIDSVLDQSYENLELIIVDDASTDDTQSVIEQYNDERMTYVKHDTNQHLSAARNTGIKMSSGKYISFLDDDDVWKKTKLERQVEKFENASDQFGLVYCWMDYYNNGKVIKERHPTLRGDIYPRPLSSQPLGNGSTWLVRADVFEVVGNFDEDIHRGVDGDFLRRLCQEYHVDYVPEVLVVYRVGHGSSRITAEDEEGIKTAIESESSKIEKYKLEFQNFPKQEAIVRAKMGWRWTQIGEWQNAFSEFKHAVRLGYTCSTVYFYMILVVYHFLKDSFE